VIATLVFEHLLPPYFPNLFHPLTGNGYQFWSGIGAGSPIIAVAGGYIHHKNCIEHGCWRVGHASPEHGHPVCRRHTKNNHPAFGPQ
jgi:hypothetical protein